MGPRPYDVVNTVERVVQVPFEQYVNVPVPVEVQIARPVEIAVRRPQQQFVQQFAQFAQPVQQFSQFAQPVQQFGSSVPLYGGLTQPFTQNLAPRSVGLP